MHSLLGKENRSEHIGESWELSGAGGNISVVANGFLKGNDLQELVEVYMGDLVGDTVYERFGTEFPILIKFIDAQDDLSIQVHPNDELAARRHNAYGKTEMWYVLEVGADSHLIAGFKGSVNRDAYLQAVENRSLPEILNVEKVEKGDVFFIPAGRVHAICRDIVVAEIQQTSDITYRIYDWDRVDASGKPREMHTRLAVDAIDFAPQANGKIRYRKNPQGVTDIVQCPCFTTRLISLQQPLDADYHDMDSFVIYICISGSCLMNCSAGQFPVGKGETVLLPAVLKNVQLIPENSAELLEVFIE